MKIPSLSALILAALTGRVEAGNFEFMNFQGWYENFDSYDEWHRSLESGFSSKWSTYDQSNAGGGTSSEYKYNKKDDKKKKKDSYAAPQSKSAPGSIDPYASFDCKENKNKFNGVSCDVILVSVNNKHCPTAKPNALAKGSFSDWQWDKTTGVTKPIDFRIECCGAEGCAPAMTPVGTYIVQQLPDQGKNKIVPGLAVFGPVADDKDPIADGEKTVIIRMGGGLK